MLPSYLVLRDFGRSNTQDHSPEYRVPTDLFILYFIRQRYMVCLHSISLFCTTDFFPSFFLLFVHDHSTKMDGLLSFILSFVHGHSTKIYGLLSFILSFCVRPFDQKLRSTLIYFFICTQPFEKLRSSLVYLFYKHTTIRSSLIYFFFSAQPFDQKLGSTLIFFYLR